MLSVVASVAGVTFIAAATLSTPVGLALVVGGGVTAIATGVAYRRQDQQH